MANLLLRPSWYLPEKDATPERSFLDRRQFLRDLGFVGGGLAAVLGRTVHGAETPPNSNATAANATATSTSARSTATPPSRYPAARNPDFNPTWRLTDETAAARLNNFYEFYPNRATDLRKLTDRFVISPWPVAVSGLVEQPGTWDVEELIAEMGFEERVYRFRCVEAWAMIVPWTGFPLSKLLQKVKPKSEAKFVRFETFNRPEQAPGMAKTAGQYPWPYFEGLRMDEAMHPLTLVVTGIYGKPLPKQHGAPLRIVVPWKYGYKSIKSIVRVELTDRQPKTFWESLQPTEYPFESNVDPAVPHPRWSQATERLIDTGDRVKTLPYNGYGDAVARLYSRA